MLILDINKLALDLVARDFGDNHSAKGAGPTRTASSLTTDCMNKLGLA